ncbi:MAG: immunoglobulin-like domain-containing protein [Patescibacteria group bacterium]
MKNLLTILKKSTTLLLIVAIVASISFIVDKPKEAKAGWAECGGYFVVALGWSKGESAATKAYGVPVAKLEAISAAVKDGSVYAGFFKDCILDSLLQPVVKMVIAKVTDSLVTWINSGFNGSPSFVTDPQQLFIDAADQVAGEFILGSPLGFMCKPFQIDIKIALALNYSYQNQYAEQAQCTLTQVVQNVDKFYQDFDEGGWAGWFEMTQKPKNTYQGAYLSAQSELAVRIGDKNLLEEMKLNWGGGFLSWTECKRKDNTTYTEYGGSKNPPTQPGKKPARVFKTDEGDNCEIKTPGSTIGESLNQALGIEKDQLGFVDSFEKLYYALANQIFTRTIAGAHGLLGSTGHGNTGNGGTTRPFDNLRDDYLKGFTDLGNGAADAARENAENQNGSTVEEDENINPEENVAVKGTGHVKDGAGRTRVDYDKLIDGDKTDESDSGFLDEEDGASYDGARTAAVDDPYLEVRLTKDYTFGKIIIYQRNSNPPLNDQEISFRVDILDKDGKIVHSSEAIKHDFIGQANIFFVPAVKGRVVRVQGIGRGPLYIGEIEAYQYAKPKITLKADSQGRVSYTTINVGQQFIDPGATAVDNNGVDISANITVEGTGTINTSLPGVHNITYSVTDVNGSSSKIVRQVQVIQ